MNMFTEYSRLFHIEATNMFRNVHFTGVGKHINLNPNRVYSVGIDQSTAQTGIAIKSIDNANGRGQIVFMLDIVNKGLPSKEIYMIMMRNFLQLIFEGIHVEQVFVEVPLDFTGNVYTRARLTELKGMINQLQVEVDSFNKAEFFSVPPNIWRKWYLADPIYKGRRVATELVKVAASDEGIKRYPLLRSYRDCFDREMDSFDALGILEGGMREVFYGGDTSIKRINSLMRATVTKYESFFDVIPMASDNLMEFVEEVVGDVEEDPESFIEERDVKVFVVDNFEKDLDDYVRLAVSSTNSICVLLFRYAKPKGYNLFKWAKELEKADDEAYCCVCWRANTVPTLVRADSFPSFILPEELYSSEVEQLDIDEEDD